jgi:hypothetical protein
MCAEILQWQQQDERLQSHGLTTAADRDFESITFPVGRFHTFIMAKRLNSLNGSVKFEAVKEKGAIKKTS